MLPILAAIPTIFSTIEKVADLFYEGKSAVSSVTGSESTATSVEELRAEVEALPDDQKASWAETLNQKTKMYAAATERLVVEQGTVPANLSKETADKVAVMRQTTRPWAIKCMIHYWMIPVYLAVVDVLQGVINAWFVEPFGKSVNIYPAFSSVFGKVASESSASALEQVFLSTTTFSELYINTLPYFSGIIISYMGLRQFGKVKGNTDHPNEADNLVRSGVGMMDKVASLFKR